MRPPATVNTVGPRRRRLSLMALAALTATLLTACTQSREVTITSECGTDVLVDWLYRSQGGNDVIDENYVIEAGEHVYADAVETEYIALLADGDVLAETSLPAEQLDTDGANPFPPMVITAESCGQLTPATESGQDDNGY